jgi:hypothetical protein
MATGSSILDDATNEADAFDQLVDLFMAIETAPSFFALVP